MRKLKNFIMAWALAQSATFALAAQPVPNTLEEAFATLDRQLPATERAAFKAKSEQDAVADAHFGLGMHIRNAWFRSGERTNLLVTLRAHHLDDASSIILTSYWRYLNGKPLEVEKQVACYDRWWKAQRRLEEAENAMGSGKGPSFSCP